MSLKLHWVPAGTSCVKSCTQVLSSTQRPEPAGGVLLAQARSNGDGSLGSPKRTIDSVNVARACRTLATSPWGEKVCTVAADNTPVVKTNAVQTKALGMR